MEDEKRDQFLDKLLDASLARHLCEEPRAGLEEKLLTRLAAERRRPPWRGWLPWAAALAAALAGILLVVLARRPPVGPRSAPVASVRPLASTRTVAAVPLASTLSPQPVVRKPRQSVVAHSRVAAPRPAQFPTPAPLSEQEKLSLQHVKSVPAPEMAAERDNGRIEPLSIPELKIVALEIKPLS